MASSALTDSLQIVETVTTADSARISFRIPENLPYFDGHFPGRPVVPAFVQLGWVLAFAREKLRLSSQLTSISSAKFLRPLLPAGNYHLEMQYTDSLGQLRFTLRGGDELCTSGKFSFAAGTSSAR